MEREQGAEQLNRSSKDVATIDIRSESALRHQIDLDPKKLPDMSDVYMLVGSGEHMTDLDGGKPSAAGNMHTNGSEGIRMS